MSDRSLLIAMRLSDSFLPVGTYTSSYGVEQYVNDGRIETADELGELVGAYLERLVGPADLVALGNAHAAAAAGDADRLRHVDRRLQAATLPAEFRESSAKAGTQLLDLLLETDERLLAGDESTTAALEYAESVAEGETPGQYPIALGVVTQRAGLTQREACLLNAYTFSTELLGAAQRLGAFGHTAIQQQLSALFPTIEAVSAEYADADLAALSSFGPLAEIMGMTHERADRRLFMS
ncbi:urease accessory protein UreF [Halovenus halobia]|uniref:urease accessory protein UreF n=1 Tax=Halovenus halobia TaxID=3396622 RepID=UPI003F55A813